MKKAKLKLTTKFMLGIGIILVCAASISSMLFYAYLKDLYIKETYQKTELVLGHINATMEYVRDELRPQMFHILPKDEFIREAMSTSFVNKGVMERFGRRFPSYIYRRVAINPMNPNNKADPFEVGLIRGFAQKTSEGPEWRGLVARNGNNYFIHVKAITMEEQCIICHGDPALAPKSLVQRYGNINGHYQKAGNVIGLESIAIPVDETFYQIRQVAFSIFLFALMGITILFLVLNYFYYTVAVKPLKKASAFFKSVVSGQKGLDVRFDVKGHDEIAEVAESFNEMVYHLEKSQGEREKIEERLRQADKLASIGQLAAGVAHEINNPLSIVLGYTKLIMKNPPVDDRIKEDLRVIHKNAEICKKIVEDLLNFARQKKTRYVQADVNATLESVISTMEDKLTESNIAIVRKYDPSVPRIYMDIDKMNQVYTNILMNAHQAIRSSGVITVSTFCDNEKKVVSIIVSDTGSGIPEDLQDKIFEPFFTTKEPGEGTGLGLAVSYGIVHEHGGEITVESKKNEGAIFTIKLPIGDMKS